MTRELRQAVPVAVTSYVASAHVVENGAAQHVLDQCDSHVGARCVAGRSGEEGFGLVELMVAVVLMLVGVLSAFVAFETSQRANGRGERTAAVAHRGQSEIERILALPYASVGMASIPTNSGSGNATDPLNYVVTSPAAGYRYDWSSMTSEPWVSLPGTGLATSVAWTDGNLSGTLYRFVTWISDPCPTCANSQDYKRVTVVLTTPGTAAPLVDSTIVTP